MASGLFIRFHAVSVIILMLAFLFATEVCFARSGKNQEIDPEVRERVQPFLLPDHHPAKASLDGIFSKSRALLSVKSMKKAGFIDPKPQKFTRLIVTRHPELKGYVIKAYLDAQRYYKDKPEHHYWLLRIKGAESIRSLIALNGWENQMKVPHKWIYELPQQPAPPSDYLRKHYILVEEDMELLNSKDNKAMWASRAVTHELLDSVFQLIDGLGLHDCVSIDNIPFSQDGRIAFIDTQTFDEWPIDYGRLTPYLSPEMKAYWKQLAKTAKR